MGDSMSLHRCYMHVQYEEANCCMTGYLLEDM